MVNPAGPLGRVTGRSAAKLHGGDQMILGSCSTQPFWQVSGTWPTPSGSSKPLRIGETRDYHRFLHPGNPSTHQKTHSAPDGGKARHAQAALPVVEKTRQAGFDGPGPAPSIGSARRRSRPAEKQIGCGAKSCIKSVKIELTCAALPKNFSDFLPALLSS